MCETFTITHREVGHEKSTTKLVAGRNVHKDSIGVAYAPEHEVPGLSLLEISVLFQYLVPCFSTIT